MLCKAKVREKTEVVYAELGEVREKTEVLYYSMAS